MRCCARATPGQYRAEDIAASFQQAVVDCLLDRTRRALAQADGATALVVAGGVAANKAVRSALEGLAAEHRLAFAAPPQWLCTDNAAMIAWAGAERFAPGRHRSARHAGAGALAARPGGGEGARRGSEGMKLGIVGGGAWGTALAQVAAANGPAMLWARSAEVVDAINRTHANPAYLPDVALSPAIQATTDAAALGECEALLLVTPAQHMRAVMAALPVTDQPLILCSKGIEAGTQLLMSEVAGRTSSGCPDRGAVRPHLRA